MTGSPPPDAAHVPPPPQPARREFMRVALTLGFGTVAIGAGFYALAARLPALAQATTTPLLALDEIGKGALAPLAKVDQWAAVDVTLTRRDAYRLRSRPQRVYVRRLKEGGNADCFAALSPVCPHAGCSIGLLRDKEEKESFACPCHAAKFDAKGARQSGPAPRGMDELVLSVAARDGRSWLMVEWRDFVPGSAEKREK